MSGDVTGGLQRPAIFLVVCNANTTKGVVMDSLILRCCPYSGCRNLSSLLSLPGANASTTHSVGYSKAEITSFGSQSLASKSVAELRATRR